MKSILRVFYAISIIFLFTSSLVFGQERKSEQKIKIVIDDGSGTKMVIDTLIKDGTMKDSIKLKDGEVIYLKHRGKDVNIENREGNEHVFVTVSDDDKKSKREVKNITVISSDSEKEDEAEEGGSADKRLDVEKTKYVIKKNGMVVSVEGSDYEKVKDLVKVIESNLDIKQSPDSKSGNAKEENKNTGKKK